MKIYFIISHYLLIISQLSKKLTNNKKLKLDAETLSHFSLLKSLDALPKNVDSSSESEQFRFYIYLSIYMLL